MMKYYLIDILFQQVNLLKRMSALESYPTENLFAQKKQYQFAEVSFFPVSY